MYKILNQTKQQNILIYGRRRIGKSLLIRKVIEKIRLQKIFYQYKNISIEKKVEQLTEAVGETFNNKFISLRDIEEVFDFIISQNDLIFVLDEYSFFNEDKVLLYSVFDGEPYYNSLIDLNKTTIENIIELAIKENSQLEMNIMATIKNETSKIACANEVLNVIALGRRKK